MSIRELNLTKEQHDWLNGWLELWGAWGLFRSSGKAHEQRNSEVYGERRAGKSYDKANV